MKRSYIKSIRCLFLGCVFLLAGSSLAMADSLEEGEPPLSCERLEILCPQQPDNPQCEGFEERCGGDEVDPDAPLSCERLDVLCPQDPDLPQCADYEERCGGDEVDPDAPNCERLAAFCPEEPDNPSCADYEELCVCSKCDELCVDPATGQPISSDACTECLAFFECSDEEEPVDPDDPDAPLSCERLDVICAQDPTDPQCADYEERCGDDEPVDPDADCPKCEEVCADDPTGAACLECRADQGCEDEPAEPISCEECQRICEEAPQSVACEECKATCVDGGENGEEPDAGGGEEPDAGGGDEPGPIDSVEEAPSEATMVGGGDGCGGCASTSGGDAAPMALLGAAFAGMIWRRKRRS